MAGIEGIHYGCEALTSGNDGTVWADASGQTNVRVVGTRLVGDTDRGAIDCPLPITLTSLYIAPETGECKTFDELTAPPGSGRPLICQGPASTSHEPRRLLPILMRPLAPGTYRAERVRLAATIDPEAGTLQGTSGQPYVVTYEGEIRVTAERTTYRVDFSLRQCADLVSLFPPTLEGEYHVPSAAAPFGARLTHLPFRLRREAGATLGLELMVGPSPVVVQQMARISEAGVGGSRFAQVRTMRDLALAVQASDETPEAIATAVTELIARTRPRTAEFIRTRVARLRQCGRYAQITTLHDLASVLQASAVNFDAIDAALQVVCPRRR